MTQQHDEPLFEALNYKDLEGQMQPVIGIDNYASKMGTDDQIIVLDFEVKSKNAATDLVGWFEKGYDFVLDADVSPGEIAPGKYLVFVEMRRRNSAIDKIENIIDDLGTLTEYTKPQDWQIAITDDKMDYSEENIRVNIQLSPKEYRDEKESELNEMRVQAGLSPKPVYTDKKDTLIQTIQSQAGIL